jgi:hypothetical protein
MIKLIFSFIVVTNIFASIITGNQGKVSVTGGSIDVSAGGVTQAVNSGEITFTGDGQAPTKARKIQRGDLNDIYDELKASDSQQSINLKYAPTGHKVAMKIRAALIKKGFKRGSFKIKRYGNQSQLILLNVEIKKIQKLYPAYYKAAKSFFKKRSNKGKVPTLTIKLYYLKTFHRKIFRKYDR